MFGSAFLGAHLMRGAAAAALLAWAIVHQTAHPWLSLGAGVAALVALRGCPMCWTVGLVETLSQGPSRLNDQIVVGVREPASRCRAGAPTVSREPAHRRRQIGTESALGTLTKRWGKLTTKVSASESIRG
jgi:hypothetical protein